MTQLKTFAFFLSPVAMGMKDPLPTFTTFVERIRDAHPNLAYLHVIEDLNRTEADPNDANGANSSDSLRKIWGDRPYVAAGGFDRASANRTVEKHGGLIAFGRHFIANVSASFAPTAGDKSHDIVL
jgi:NADPH2 dehydrogenase